MVPFIFCKGSRPLHLDTTHPVKYQLLTWSFLWNPESCRIFSYSLNTLGQSLKHFYNETTTILYRDHLQYVMIPRAKTQFNRGLYLLQHLSTRVWFKGNVAGLMQNFLAFLGLSINLNGITCIDIVSVCFDIIIESNLHRLALQSYFLL